MEPETEEFKSFRGVQKLLEGIYIPLGKANNNLELQAALKNFNSQITNSYAKSNVSNLDINELPDFTPDELKQDQSLRNKID